MTFAEIKNIYQKANKQLQEAPDGKLIYAMCHGNCQFYNYLGNKRKEYIPVGEKEFRKALAQKLYNERVVKVLDKQIRCLEHYYKNRDIDCLKKIYGSLPQAIRELVVPYELPTEEYVTQWENRKFRKMKHDEGEKCYKTDKGDMVRSKSEVIIANKLFALGIPYRYECELELKTGITVHPDFTILNRTNRKEYILEHFGMLDNEQYANSFVRKIKTYAEAGIVQGDTLLCTYESGCSPFDTQTLDIIIKKFLI